MEPPKGQRFSHVYLRHPDLLSDSKRMRRRLAATFTAFDDLGDFGRLLEVELGIPVSSEARYGSFWPPFLDKCELRDVLDAITLRYRTILDYNDRPDTESRAAFVRKVTRIFKEETVRYRIDSEGGVHFAVDSEFESSRVATIVRLGKQRYTAVRTAFEDALGALDETPPNGKAAIRSAFFAVEGLFRLIFPSAHQLSASEVQKHLRPLIDKSFDGQKPAIYLAQKQIAAFSDWIDGAHFYRHEPGSEEPAQPPLSLAVYMTAQAAAHLRWLVEFDTA